ncbi:MAG: hypothetical protein K2X27_24890, partial [Candidatus Obscuribacterales bacterium]|nr:hypothetical protein [Candidatus Obscuribacterales bacterium]
MSESEIASDGEAEKPRRSAKHTAEHEVAPAAEDPQSRDLEKPEEKPRLNDCAFTELSRQSVSGAFRRTTGELPVAGFMDLSEGCTLNAGDKATPTQETDLVKPDSSKAKAKAKESDPPSQNEIAAVKVKTVSVKSVTSGQSSDLQMPGAFSPKAVANELAPQTQTFSYKTPLAEAESKNQSFSPAALPETQRLSSAANISKTEPASHPSEKAESISTANEIQPRLVKTIAINTQAAPDSSYNSFKPVPASENPAQIQILNVRTQSLDTVPSPANLAGPCDIKSAGPDAMKALNVTELQNALSNYKANSSSDSTARSSISSTMLDPTPIAYQKNLDRNNNLPVNSDTRTGVGNTETVKYSIAEVAGKDTRADYQAMNKLVLDSPAPSKDSSINSIMFNPTSIANQSPKLEGGLATGGTGEKSYIAPISGFGSGDKQITKADMEALSQSAKDGALSRSSLQEITSTIGKSGNDNGKSGIDAGGGAARGGSGGGESNQAAGRTGAEGSNKGGAEATSGRSGSNSESALASSHSNETSHSRSANSGRTDSSSEFSRNTESFQSNSSAKSDFVYAKSNDHGNDKVVSEKTNGNDQHETKQQVAHLPAAVSENTPVAAKANQIEMNSNASLARSTTQSSGIVSLDSISNSNKSQQASAEKTASTNNVGNPALKEISGPISLSALSNIVQSSAKGDGIIPAANTTTASSRVLASEITALNPNQAATSSVIGMGAAAGRQIPESIRSSGDASMQNNISAAANAAGLRASETASSVLAGGKGLFAIDPAISSKGDGSLISKAPLSAQNQAANAQLNTILAGSANQLGTAGNIGTPNFQPGRNPIANINGAAGEATIPSTKLSSLDIISGRPNTPGETGKVHDFDLSELSRIQKALGGKRYLTGVEIALAVAIASAAVAKTRPEEASDGSPAADSAESGTENLTSADEEELLNAYENKNADPDSQKKTSLF